jgi:NTE family protein
MLTMNENQREMLMTCLTQIFGRVEDVFIDSIVPMLRWIELRGGQTLLRQGDAEDGVYMVISGRLRATRETEDGVRVVGEIVQGQTVGEMAVLMNEPHSDLTVYALRDSVLAHVTRESFEELTFRQPQLPLYIARVVIERMRRAGARSKPSRPKTICLLPITDGVDVTSIAEQLTAHLERWGVVRLETARSIDERFGEGTAQSTPSMAEAHHKLTMWLDDLEFWHEYVVFAADPGDTEWTQRCIRHADQILLLARADAPPRVHPLEEKYLTGSAAVAAEQTLVLLHAASTTQPSGTPAWLDRRAVQRHIHIRPDLPRDMARFARMVGGNAVGLVLAGGGARGFAHLGALKALEEAGVVVDCVGGTSIGAVMAALASLDVPADVRIEHARKAFSSNPTGDMNFLPFISLLRGRKLKRVIDKGVVDSFGFAADASDTWRNFFCIATNFSRAREMVLTRGDLATVIRASVSIPVALPPVIYNGELLVDGGTFNNFPTDVMINAGAARIIGVDLGRQKTRTYEFNEVPGPLAMLVDRFRPYSKRRYKLPTLGAILMETSIMYSTSRQGIARQSVDLYINPELTRIGLLDWKAFDRTVELGYKKTKEVLASLPEETLSMFRDV